MPKYRIRANKQGQKTKGQDLGRRRGNHCGISPQGTQGKVYASSLLGSLIS